MVAITVCSDDPLLIGEREAMAKYDAFPASPFMKALSEHTEIIGGENGITAVACDTNPSGEKRVVRLIIGFTFESSYDKICEELMTGKAVSESVCAFAKECGKVIPLFENEKDEVLRQELRWHAYNLEAMATYSEYYDETKIPQGTIYDYHWGQHASARDNFQHALPLVYYNPRLAKSVLRYMLIPIGMTLCIISKRCHIIIFSLPGNPI